MHRYITARIPPSHQRACTPYAPPPKPAPSTGELYLHLPGQWAQPCTLCQAPEPSLGGTDPATSLACAGTGYAHTSNSISGRETGLFWLRGAAALDLALFCFSLQVSAVFGHSPVSPAIFQASCSRGGSGQPGGSSAEVTLAPSSGDRRQPPAGKGCRPHPGVSSAQSFWQQHSQL